FIFMSWFIVKSKDQEDLQSSYTIITIIAIPLFVLSIVGAMALIESLTYKNNIIEIVLLAAILVRYGLRSITIVILLYMHKAEMTNNTVYRSLMGHLQNSLAKYHTSASEVA